MSIFSRGVSPFTHAAVGHSLWLHNGGGKSIIQPHEFLGFQNQGEKFWFFKICMTDDAITAASSSQ